MERVRNSRWNRNPIDANLVISMYGELKSPYDISKELGVTSDRIRRLLKINNIKILSKSELYKNRNQSRKDYTDNLIVDYNNRMSLACISKKYSIGVAKVRLIIKSEGLTIRDRAASMIEGFRDNKRKITYNRKGTKNIFNGIYHQWIGGAKIRGIPFNVSKEYLQSIFEKQNGKCAYTGIDLISPVTLKDRKANSRNPKMISLDRIDSELGYEVGNVHFVCSWINKGKSNTSHDLFKKIINELKEHWAV